MTRADAPRRAGNMTEALQRVAAAQTAAGQPGATLQALADALAGTAGFKLFTVLLHDPAAGEIRRAYSNMPAEYPTGGAKPITGSPWMRQVLQLGEPYVGRDREDIRAVFFDYELILSLGCESVLNLPVRWDGRVLAVLNLLHESGWYNDVDPGALLPLAQFAVPALQLMQRE